jgi:FlaG/FlaF family flagellin (archaellin)
MISYKSRRAVSVVISTLLVLAITIVGALSISNLMSTSALTTVNQTPKAIIAANSVLLAAYDTRDGTSLFNIASFNNKFDNVLCTVCATNPNNTPATGGTDFIVLQLWNKNSNPIHIKTLQVNGISHTWDFQTQNVNFKGNTSPPDYPRAGMFSIIPTSSQTLTQQNSQLVEGDQEVILVVKLSQFFTSNIELGKPLRILVNIGDEQPAEYVILSGETK